MKKSVFVFAFSTFVFVSGQLLAQGTTTAPKDSTKADTVKKASTAATTSPTQQSTDVVKAIAGSGYNTTLSSEIKNTGLDAKLNDGQQYTVFAPNDKAFANNKTKTDALFKNKATEQKVLKNHIVKGRYTKDEIIKALTANKGTTTLTTVDGDKITLKVNSFKHLEILDSDGNKAEVTQFDLQGNNGVAHVVDNILLAQ